jgi:hypothetical protein
MTDRPNPDDSDQRISRLLRGEPVVANVGIPLFSDALRMQGKQTIDIDWRPPASGKEEMFSILKALRMGVPAGRPTAGDQVPADRINKANAEVLDRITGSHPFLVGVGKAIEEIPGMRRDLVLHAGPPITWDRMCGPMQGAVIGALIYEGLAGCEEDARKLASSGKIDFEPCHHHNAVGPMAGVVSPSMPVWIVENRTYGNRAFCTLNEGLGKVLRYGAFSDEVIERLKWIEATLAPVLREAIGLLGEIDLRNLIAQALQMGDEGHNRNRAGTSLLIRELAPAIARAGVTDQAKSDVLAFIHSNDHFFLNLTMPAGKACLDAAAGTENSSIVTAMARNGTDFGIRVSGTRDRWFTAQAPAVKGLYFPGYTEADANRDIGDSTICETYGIGGFAMAAAPAIVEFVGGTVQDAVRFTVSMYEIAAGESSHYRIPAMGFRGTPTGIDIIRVVEKGIVPAVNTGIAHRRPGIGQVGAGLVEPPMAVFEDALKSLYEVLMSTERP